MSGLIPKRTKSETMIWKNITLSRVIGILMSLMIGTIFSNFVASKLSIFFIAFCIVEFLVLTMKSPVDPMKKFYQSLIKYIEFKSQPVLQYGVNSEEYKDYLAHQKERSEKSDEHKETAYDIAKEKRRAKFEYRQRKKQAKLEAKQAYKEKIRKDSD